MQLVALKTNPTLTLIQSTTRQFKHQEQQKPVLMLRHKVFLHLTLTHNISAKVRERVCVYVSYSITSKWLKGSG